MVPEILFPHSPVPATCPYPEPDQSNPCSLNSTFWRCILILSSYLRLGLSNGLLPSGSPHTRCIHIFLPPLKPHATPILLLIVRMTYGDGTGRDRTSPIPVTAQSKAWICGHFFVRIEVLYPASSTVFSLLRVLCVVRKWMSLQRIDASSRGVLPSVVCLSLISKPRQGGSLDPIWPPSHDKKHRTSLNINSNLQTTLATSKMLQFLIVLDFWGLSRLNVMSLGLCNKHYYFTKLSPSLDVECLIRKKTQKNNNFWKVYAYL